MGWARAMLVAVLAAALVTGCSDEPGSGWGLQDPEGELAPLVDAGPRQAGDLPEVTVRRDDLAERDDLALSPEVGLEDVLEKAVAGPSPEEGEEFALAASLYLADDENGEVGPEEVATLVAAEAVDTAQYVYSQMGIPERLGLPPARIDTDEVPWLRTEVVADGRIRTALALYVLYPGVFDEFGKDGMWVIFTTESRHRAGAWQLTHWVNGTGPDRLMPDPQHEIYFDRGKGWRRPSF